MLLESLNSAPIQVSATVQSAWPSPYSISITGIDVLTCTGRAGRWLNVFVYLMGNCERGCRFRLRLCEAGSGLLGCHTASLDALETGPLCVARECISGYCSDGYCCQVPLFIQHISPGRSGACLLDSGRQRDSFDI